MSTARTQDCVNFVLRELLREEEILDHFRLRHRVYVDAGFKAAQDNGLDVTKEDLYSRFFGAFTLIDDQEVQIGAIRMIYRDRLSPHFELVADLLNVDSCAAKSERRQLPTEQAFGLTAEIEQRLGLHRLVEFSRTCIDKPNRGKKLTYGLIDGIIAIACEDGVRYGLGSCDVNLASLYQSFGFPKMAGIPAQVYPAELGIESYCLLGDLHDLPEPHGTIVANFRRMIRNSGYIAQCANAVCFTARNYANTHKNPYRCPLDSGG